MKVAITCHRPFHLGMLANVLAARADSVDIYASAPRKFFKGLDDTVRTHFAPAPVRILAHLFPVRFSPGIMTRDILVFDRTVAAMMGRPEICFGLAAQSLYTAKAAKRRGGLFVLDRACPHCDFQQALIRRESERVGVPFKSQPAWFRERQLEEYEVSDAILVPSKYSARTFPDQLTSKLVKAPLMGRTKLPESGREEPNEQFTVGVVGGDPLRKGYLYLLRAWKKLALPSARLLIRSSTGFGGFPALEALVKEMPSVELVGYVPNLSDFYRRCDVFVLPSVDDGFGMALVEAMSNFVPCVATSNCGASELLTDGVDGIVVEPANEDQLEEAILRLYQSEELRRSIGEAAAKTARQLVNSGQYSLAIESLMAGISEGRVELADVPNYLFEAK
jgi:glycosyltransferase involved in cell wall biosynthesis